MKHLANKAGHDENGSVLIMVLILLAVMSVIGLTASMTSRTEIAISHNERLSKRAFYAADSGVAIAPFIVSQVIEQGSAPTIPNIQLSASLMNEVMGYLYEDASVDSVTPTIVNPDVKQTIGEVSYNMDIDRDPSGPRYMPGGGVQFASGAEGVGAGTAGGIQIFYSFDIAGNVESTNAISHIDAYYRKVAGVAGR